MPAGVSCGGIKLCPILAGATDDGSPGGIKSCLLLVDQRWCSSGWKRGGMGHHRLLVYPPAVSG
jgi:hypothetical protein